MGADIDLRCECGHEVSAPPRWGSRVVRCPACGQELLVPAPPAEQESWQHKRRAARRRTKDATTTPQRLSQRRLAPDANGLRIAARQQPDDLVAVRRRKRTRRLIILATVVVVLVAGAVAGHYAWRSYRRALYRGHDPQPIPAQATQRPPGGHSNERRAQ